MHDYCAYMSTPTAATVHLDSTALAVLAHPLRSRLLDELRISGPATATTLAAALHTNSGATSYHLRAFGHRSDQIGLRCRQRLDAGMRGFADAVGEQQDVHHGGHHGRTC